MATRSDVRRIAQALPGVSEDPRAFRFLVDGKQFVWLWPERVDPKKPRVTNPGVLVVRVANDIDKHVILAMDREVFFTEPHYDGYPAVLVRLAAIERGRLRELLTQAWECRAPKALRAKRRG